MKVICSYCRKAMKDKEPFDDDRVSHGMCRECYAYYEDQIDGLSLDGFLEKFDTPVFIADKDGRMAAANKMAADMVGRSQKEIFGLLGGEVMECQYARLPEGCGKTVHCLACSIRNTVMGTMARGEPQRRVPVKLRQVAKDVDMVISTEKIGPLVRIVIE